MSSLPNSVGKNFEGIGKNFEGTTRRCTVFIRISDKSGVSMSHIESWTRQGEAVQLYLTSGKYVLVGADYAPNVMGHLDSMTHSTPKFAICCPHCGATWMEARKMVNMRDPSKPLGECIICRKEIFFELHRNPPEGNDE
jgi:hypothetical protein